MGRIKCTKLILCGRRVEREHPENILEITNKDLIERVLIEGQHFQHHF
jgi:hypothetical protein